MNQKMEQMSRSAGTRVVPASALATALGWMEPMYSSTVPEDAHIRMGVLGYDLALVPSRMGQTYVTAR